ncbi:hypothetical protein CICLE_v10033945mg [Citrus x clementina]|uniref:Auxin-responsive protein n=1 Tax=Citrus clementina TaxID=85681 RepID=V4SRD0_CITCL|nr:hypothetical protein CICLE_v10033945mg [Citrus x clementina]
MWYMKNKKGFQVSGIYVRLRGHKLNKEDGDRARKGYVPVLVGQEEMVMERVLIPTKLIDHPYIVSLLELSAKEFGYHQQGLLQVPYDANCLKKMVHIISREKQYS